MEWRSLKEFPDYQFSNKGHVKKGDKYVKTFLEGYYPAVTLSNKFVKRQFKIHHVIAELFIGPCPEGQLVRHLDDDRENIDASNLAYGTHYDNKQDAIRNGRVPKGEKHYSKTHPEKVPKGEQCFFSKLTQNDVDEIKSVENYYGCIKMLAEKFNVHTGTISRIRRGLTWK